jgi:hypothetical protein
MQVVQMTICVQVETGPNGGYPIQIHLPAEEILIQVINIILPSIPELQHFSGVRAEIFVSSASLGR